MATPGTVMLATSAEMTRLQGEAEAKIGVRGIALTDAIGELRPQVEIGRDRRCQETSGIPETQGTLHQEMIPDETLAKLRSRRHLLPRIHFLSEGAGDFVVEAEAFSQRNMRISDREAVLETGTGSDRCEKTEIANET